VTRSARYVDRDAVVIVDCADIVGSIATRPWCCWHAKSMWHYPGYRMLCHLSGNPKKGKRYVDQASNPT
jgi:hypothetical protein